MDHRSSFVDRHIGPNQYQIQTMLLELGFKDLDSFIKAVVPANIHIKGEIEEALPQALSEAEALAEIKAIEANMGQKLIRPHRRDFSIKSPSVFMINQPLANKV